MWLVSILVTLFSFGKKKSEAEINIKNLNEHRWSMLSSHYIFESFVTEGSEIVPIANCVILSLSKNIYSGQRNVDHFLIKMLLVPN